MKHLLKKKIPILESHYEFLLVPDRRFFYSCMEGHFHPLAPTLRRVNLEVIKKFENKVSELPFCQMLAKTKNITTRESSISINYYYLLLKFFFISKTNNRTRNIGCVDIIICCYIYSCQLLFNV